MISVGPCSVYVLVETEGSPRFLKIGVSADVVRRVAKRTLNPRGLRLVGSVELESRDRAIWLERYLHILFEEWRKSGEWFGVGVNDIDAMADAVLGAAELSVEQDDFEEPARAWRSGARTPYPLDFKWWEE